MSVNPNYRAPDNIVTRSRSELLEYHIHIHKESGRLPVDLKLSDRARGHIIDIIDSLWNETEAERKIAIAVFNFCLGFCYGMEGSKC